jgi:2-dehydro-3-deoxygluconokinase
LSAPRGALIIDAAKLAVHVAGTELNVAAAVARMGYRAAWLSRLPDTSLGRRVTEHARVCGVDERFVKWQRQGRLGTYYYEPGAAPRSGRVIYDRTNSTAASMEFGDFDWNSLAEVRCLHVTGITAGISDRGANLVQQAIQWARERGTQVIFDLNYRALLWGAEQCRRTIEPMLGSADVLLTTARDANQVLGVEGTPEQILQTLQRRFGCEAIAVTIGSEGAVAGVGNHYFNVPGYPVEIVNRIGAGDSFAAGVICGMLENDFSRGVQYGVAMSSLILTITGDTFAFSRKEVLDLLQEGPGANIVR